VLNEKFNSNLGTDLTCMLQCGDILVFGGAHGFVGIGVGVPHSGSSNEDHESSVAIVCVFPTTFPASSSTRANTSSGVGERERERERERENAIEWEDKIEREGENVNGSPESYDSPSSYLPDLPSTTYESEEYYGDVIPVPSTPRTLLAYDRVKKNKNGQGKEIEIVVQSEIPKDLETDEGKVEENERVRGVDVDIATETEIEREREAERKEEEEQEEEEAPVEASMAVLRARGHGYNSNITCLATHSLESGTDLCVIIVLVSAPTSLPALSISYPAPLCSALLCPYLVIPFTPSTLPMPCPSCTLLTPVFFIMNMNMFRK
jgi:hypothetical protein